MAEALLRLSGLTKRFGGLVVTDNLDLAVSPGSTHAIIGPNGAGKTTLLAQIQGDLRPDGGRILFRGREVSRLAAHRRAGLGIARTFQITSIFPEFSVIDNVRLARQAHVGHSFHFWTAAARESVLLAPAEQALARVGLAHRQTMIAQDLSHGERRQMELAMALAMEPTLLILDEPMAGMGTQDTGRIVRLLEACKRDYTILLVEHDMDTVFSLADRVTVLVAGRNIATGTPDEIRADAGVRAAYLGHADG